MTPWGLLPNPPCPGWWLLGCAARRGALFRFPPHILPCRPWGSPKKRAAAGGQPDEPPARGVGVSPTTTTY